LQSITLKKEQKVGKAVVDGPVAINQSIAPKKEPEGSEATVN